MIWKTLVPLKHIHRFIVIFLGVIDVLQLFISKNQVTKRYLKHGETITTHVNIKVFGFDQRCEIETVSINNDRSDRLLQLYTTVRYYLFVLSAGWTTIPFTHYTADVLIVCWTTQARINTSAWEKSKIGVTRPITHLALHIHEFSIRSRLTSFESFLAFFNL